MIIKALVLVACVSFAVGDTTCKKLSAFKKLVHNQKEFIKKGGVNEENMTKENIVDCIQNGEVLEVTVAWKGKAVKYEYKSDTDWKILSTPAYVEDHPCADGTAANLEGPIDSFIGFDVKASEIIECVERMGGDKEFVVRTDTNLPVKEGSAIKRRAREISVSYQQDKPNIPGGENFSFIGDMDLFEDFVPGDCNASSKFHVGANKNVDWKAVFDSSLEFKAFLAANKGLSDEWPAASLEKCFKGKDVLKEHNYLIKAKTKSGYCGIDYREDSRGDWFGCVAMGWSADDDFRLRLI